MIQHGFNARQWSDGPLCFPSLLPVTASRSRGRCVAWFCLCLLLVPAMVGHAMPDIYLADGTLLDANSPAPTGAQPVLFVHGHKFLVLDPEPYYRATWVQSLDSTLRSFGETLAHAENNGLDIEPYYLNFGVHNRSLVEDARAIGEAVERLLARHHDATELPLDESQPPRVRVVIIANSKGTISARLYLKSLQQQQYDLPPPRPSFHPVSEFIAIAPPNHGLKLDPGATSDAALSAVLAFFLVSTPGQQLSNGFRGDNCHRIFPPALSARNFIEALNGHALADSHISQFDPAADYPAEAPGSRDAAEPPTHGTLYVTLYDANGRDSVGGDAPVVNDCTTTPLYGSRQQGRKLARNLAAHAVNIPVVGIPGTPPGTDAIIEALTVHQNTVHDHNVICKALYTAVYQQAPDATLTCVLTPEGLPIIP